MQEGVILPFFCFLFIFIFIDGKLDSAFPAGHAVSLGLLFIYGFLVQPSARTTDKMRSKGLYHLSCVVQI